MKFCPQCGTPGGDDQKFCVKCGADVSAAVAAPPLYYPPPKKTSNKTVIIIIAAIFLVMAIPIILIVAAIAIPNLIRAKMSANQASAVASVRTLNVALLTYQSTYGHYPVGIAQLGPASNGPVSEDHAGLIDPILTSGNKNGYGFLYELVPKQEEKAEDGFMIHADPLQPNTTGTTHYYSDQSGVIRVDYARPATAESPPLE